MQRSWKHLIRELLDRLPRQFELRDVIAHKDELAAYYPNNKHIEAKVRQTLQVLRDQGVLRFDGKGRYTHLRAQTRFSPLIDFSTAADFSSRAQVGRVVLETWAEFNLYCVNCESDELERLPANTPVADFRCATCHAQYQLKGKNGRFGGTIAGAAYQPLLDAVREKRCPEFVLLEYDVRFSSVVFALAVPGNGITEARIIKRRELSASARRAGWVGCNIDVEGLPRVALVRPEVVDPADARGRWNELRPA